MPATYDVIVIGGGAAGLSAAGLSANLGARTLLIEKSRLGGDCTWTGCVPSKTLLHAARVADTVRQAKKYGIEAGELRVDFEAVMRQVRDIREQIYQEADTPELIEEMGVNVRRARARFRDEHQIELDDGEVVEGRYIIIAAGSSPRMPHIRGLAGVPFESSESIFERTAQPKHLIIVGAGPVGIELAQAYRRLGSAVTVVDRTARILQQDDEAPAAMLQAVLAEEGVAFHLERDIREISHDGAQFHLRFAGIQDRLSGDALLVAAGRTPNVDALNLRAAGIDYDEQGIRINDRCRTSVSHIYAIGDVTGRFNFAHMSEHAARTAIFNALLKVPRRIDDSHVCWATFTEPELAHVGATETALRESGRRFEVYRFPYDRLDRAITDDATVGMIQIYARPLDGKILGASVLGARAGELISEIALAMRNGIPMRKISDTIHPYPTYGIGVRRAADQWYVKRRSVRLLRGLQRIFGYRGLVRKYDPNEIL